MRDDWLFFMDMDGGNPHIFRRALLMQSGYIWVSGSSAFQGALNCFSKFTTSLLFWLSNGSSCKVASNSQGLRCSTQITHISSGGSNLARPHFDAMSKGEFFNPVSLRRISFSVIRNFVREGERLRSSSVLALAAMIPSLDNL